MPLVALLLRKSSPWILLLGSKGCIFFSIQWFKCHISKSSDWSFLLMPLINKNLLLLVRSFCNCKLGLSIRSNNNKLNSKPKIWFIKKKKKRKLTRYKIDYYRYSYIAEYLIEKRIRPTYPYKIYQLMWVADNYFHCYISQ